jgi:hypothetical protein
MLERILAGQEEMKAYQAKLDADQKEMMAKSCWKIV